jgi:hypothetical protein
LKVNKSTVIIKRPRLGFVGVVQEKSQHSKHSHSVVQKN